MVKERGNGANVVVLNNSGEILVVRQNYGEKKWMLPGGEIERGESPRHAAQEETEEESGVIIDENDLRLIAYFVQRPKGILFLFESLKFSGEINPEPNNEILEVRFMDFKEIIGRGDEFLLAYKRMILQYMRCAKCIDPVPFEGRLSNTVEYPKDLGIEKFSDLVLRV